MPKININGIVRDMTPEEIAEMERQAAEIPAQPQTELENRLNELEDAFNLLLTGAVE